jgi:hypothetical protein
MECTTKSHTAATATATAIAIAIAIATATDSLAVDLVLLTGTDSLCTTTSMQHLHAKVYKCTFTRSAHQIVTQQQFSLLFHTF